MKVYINGRFLTQPLSGVQRTAREVVRELDRRLSNSSARHRYVLVLPRNAPDGAERLVSSMPTMRGKLGGNLFEQMELPWMTRDGLLLGLGSMGPMVKRRQVVFMYDANVYLVPEAFKPAFRVWYKFMMPLLGRTVRHILVDSENARQELGRFARIPLRKMTVAHLGVDHIDPVRPDHAIIDRCGLRGSPYVLAVSNKSPNKNFARLVAAIGLLPADVRVVVAGGAHPRVFGKVDEGSPSNVLSLGFVSDEELKALYTHAGCFVYPSLYEGFGLPPVEAMRCGCPVVVSDSTSLPEVCADAAEYCDPLRPADIARAIGLVAGSPEVRQRLQSRGAVRSAHFTWSRTTDVVERVLAEAARE